MSTRREQLLARAERLREWAEKRRARATASHSRADRISSVIPFGQPILVGHHSEGRHRRDLDRIDRAMRSAIESSDLAASMESRADSIESAASRAIYSDDPDAREALEAKIAVLEAERDRIRAYNKSVRAGKRDLDLLDDQQQESLKQSIRFTPWATKGGAFPTYGLTNLSGNINRLKKRIGDVERRAERTQAAENTSRGVLITPFASSVTVTFAEKPSRDILSDLRVAGFFWSSGSWHGSADRLPDSVRRLAE